MMFEPIVNQPTLDAGWFDLRPLRKADQGMIAHYGGDARVAGMTPSLPHPMPPGFAADLVMRGMAEDRRSDVWALDATRDGGAEFMGLITLDRVDRDQSEFAYWLALPFWGKGVAQMAVRAVCEGNPLNNRTIFAAVFQDNPASAKVLTNCGFEYLGDAESYSLARDATVPTWTYVKAIT